MLLNLTGIFQHAYQEDSHALVTFQEDISKTSVIFALNNYLLVVIH